MKYKKEDKELRRAIGELPQFAPSDDLWESIEESLTTETVKKRNPMVFVRVAAAIILIGVFAFVLRNILSTQDEFTYSEELEVTPVQMVSGFLQDKEFIDLLDSECVDTRPVCEEDEFKELLAQLNAVQDEAKQLVSMIDESGMDRYLLKAKSKLEKEDAEIKKRIVAYLRD